MNRRHFLRTSSLAALAVAGCTPALDRRTRPVLNDIHSQLNATEVDEVVRPATVDELRAIVLRAKRERQAISVAGGRHSMGGQQFARGSIHVDTRSLDQVLAFDPERGHLEAGAGIQWPDLVADYLRRQEGSTKPWGFVQKPTGADRFTLGGTLASNAHGRVLTRPPIVGDVESFEILDAAGELRTCSREQNAELFRLAIGGYGMFGIMTRVTLRLAPRQKVERAVELIDVDELAGRFADRIREGYAYGDFQFSTDAASEEFLSRGVFSCYRPVEDDRPIPPDQRRLSDDDWRGLLYLAHADKAAGFKRYSTYYLGTNGQRYWSDTHQMGTYIDDYHVALDRQLGAKRPGTEMIGELYVPRAELASFLVAAREDFRRHAVDVIYGTTRLIEQDRETFLPWAKQAYACTVFNLHTEHSSEGRDRSAQAFRRLIDLASSRGGSYYLTYHRWAERRQVETCYPQFGEFIAHKRRYDPEGRFQSEWWRHQTKLLGRR